MKKLIILLSSLQMTCFANLSVKELPISETKNLQSYVSLASPGDYIAAESGKMTTVITIRSITPEWIVLEEISAPTKNLNPRPASWAAWIKAKAPGHSSWSIIKMDRQSGKILECYSVSRSCYVQVSEKESLFATLLSLPLKSVLDDKRRRIGPPPSPGDPDFRKFWQPQLSFEGKKVDEWECEVFEAIWPKDGSELEGREVTLYFDKNKRTVLPIWIQIETAHAVGNFRTIDCGRNLISPVK